MPFGNSGVIPVKSLLTYCYTSLEEPHSINLMRGQNVFQAFNLYIYRYVQLLSENPLHNGLYKCMLNAFIHKYNKNSPVYL